MSVIKYYDELAENYDNSRFANSYGYYIDSIERAILNTWLKNTDKNSVIDFGCGTGRLLDYAMTGLDGSANMLEIAAKKFPHHTLIQADIANIPPNLKSFNTGICFHVLMHLEHTTIQQFFTNAASVINPNGNLIVDVLATPRRKLFKKQKTGWHGNTAFTIPELAKICEPNWKIKQWRGIILIPIHRLPSFLRPALAKLDQALCRSFLGRYASYYIVELERVA